MVQMVGQIKVFQQRDRDIIKPIITLVGNPTVTLRDTRGQTFIMSLNFKDFGMS